MARIDEARRRGSFYRFTVDSIARVHPNRSPAWHRRQAREVLDAVNKAGSPAALPMWTPEDIEKLRDDFGEPLFWQSARAAGESPVEVAANNGIVGIRNRAHPETVLLLTKSEFRSFVDDIVSRRFDFSLPHDDPRAAPSRLFVEQLIKLSDESKLELKHSVAPPT